MNGGAPSRGLDEVGRRSTEAGGIARQWRGAVLQRLRSLCTPDEAGPPAVDRAASRVEAVQLAHEIEHGFFRPVPGRAQDPE
ncbi:hypothetical protein C5C56_13540 [Rathayibacter sp. AY1D1]|nr:hypothetical protein C5E14_06320 [Rathayibacter sp. AY1A1]PPH28764.1 hypothetical protein C5C37_09525 [Rathayibacter sp. AY1F9]PPH55817.1 hypothetical protein C5C67_02915 [Rathayibacter sp. AY1E1]PPH96934.1 hypothetical protein C5C56_13540 [Rathayibacter sp. AY1D1]